VRFPFEPNTPVPGLVPGTQVLNPLTDKARPRGHVINFRSRAARHQITTQKNRHPGEGRDSTNPVHEMLKSGSRPSPGRRSWEAPSRRPRILRILCG